jgi:phasin family protein
MTKQSTAGGFEDAAVDVKNTAADIGNETAERAVHGLKEASARAASLAADTQKSLGDNIEKFASSLQHVSSFNQQNIEAFAKSSEIAAKALQGIGNEVAGFAKKSHEERVAAAQDIATAKTVAELIEKQTSFAQNAFEGWVRQATKVNEIYASAAKDIAAPIGHRFAAAAEEIKALGQ